jgi:hypothetical protein
MLLSNVYVFLFYFFFVKKRIKEREMNILSAEILAPLLSVLVALLSGLATFVVKWLKSKGINIELDSTLQIIDKARQLVVEAESKQNYDGSEKLNYVTSRLIAFCQEKGFKIDVAKIKDVIEGIIGGHNSIIQANAKFNPDHLQQKIAQVASQNTMRENVAPTLTPQAIENAKNAIIGGGK